MPSTDEPATTGLLLSGGLDSAVLLGQLLNEGQRVQPFHVCMDFLWQREELRAATRYREAVGWTHAKPGQLLPLVALEMPVADLYGPHWSITGRETPGEHSADEAVYLPGHNALLLLKVVLWCHSHGVDRVAIASLANNPFGDATSAFFESFEAALRLATGGTVRITRPFERLTKRDVMQRDQSLPLELTFSCLAPVRGLHCGRCNKCAERRQAFQHWPSGDPTPYAK